MAIINLTENGINSTIEKEISLCKSNSGICGKELRNAHMQLGKNIGIQISTNNAQANRIAVIVMMRAGLSFALGIADELENNEKSVNIIFSTEEKTLPNDFDPALYNLIIIVNAVIRTGKRLISLADSIDNKQIIFATNVLDETGISNFNKRTVYTVRISQNSFIGSNQKTVLNGRGPDTGDRLFNSNFTER